MMTREEAEKLEAKFNELFAHYVAKAGNPQLRGYQRDLLEFFVQGYKYAEQPEEGDLLKGRVVASQMNGLNIDYTIRTQGKEFVNMNNVRGILVDVIVEKSEETEVGNDGQ